MAYPSRQAYIEQVADYAIDQMIKYGIPASVTLAQACIESGNGGSVLVEFSPENEQCIKERCPFY